MKPFLVKNVYDSLIVLRAAFQSVGKKIWYFTTSLFVLFFSVCAFAAIDALDFDSPQQEMDYRQLTQELRCPQCQNNNIADSNATIAVDMRTKVLELLQEGRTKPEIVDYMVERYGNFVTYDPPLTPLTLVLWVVPSLLILLGISLILRRKSKIRELQRQNELNSVIENLTEAEKERLRELLKEKE